MTQREYNGLVQTWRIPCLTDDAANQLMREAEDLAQRVLDGFEVTWDGHNHVGVLSSDARKASEEIAGCIEDVSADAETVQYADAGEWFDWTADPLGSVDLDAHATDADLERVGAEVEAEAMESMRTVLPARDVVEYLTERRAELRAELREELEQVAERVAQATKRRDELIALQVGWGDEANDSLRDVGERAGLTHSGVRRIAHKMWARWAAERKAESTE